MKDAITFIVYIALIIWGIYDVIYLFKDNDDVVSKDGVEVVKTGEGFTSNFKGNLFVTGSFILILIFFALTIFLRNDTDKVLQYIFDMFNIV